MMLTCCGCSSLDTLLIFSTFFLNSERKKQPKKSDKSESGQAGPSMTADDFSNISSQAQK